MWVAWELPEKDFKGLKCGERHTVLKEHCSKWCIPVGNFCRWKFLKKIWVGKFLSDKMLGRAEQTAIIKRQSID